MIGAYKNVQWCQFAIGKMRYMGRGNGNDKCDTMMNVNDKYTKTFKYKVPTNITYQHKTY